MKELLYGNRGMIACVCCYLAWWIITFRPPAPKGSLMGSICLLGAFLFGVGGIFLIVHGIINMADKPVVNSFIPVWIIPVLGIIAYMVLLFVSANLFHRQVTSELFIIVGWTVLELCFVGTLYRYGAIGRGNPAAYITGIIIVTVVSMVCYLLYYDLEYVKGYIDGMIPLILTGIMMVIINLGVRK